MIEGMCEFSKLSPRILLLERRTLRRSWDPEESIYNDSTV